MLDPDSQLMLKFKSGDTISFEKLVKKYKEKIVNVIYQFIGDKEEAEDLAIEVFLSCLLYTSPSPRDVEESRMPSSA